MEKDQVIISITKIQKNNLQMSTDGSASRSGSSNSSSSQLSFFQDSNIIDLTLFGCPAPTFIRTGTVVRRATIPFRKDRTESNSSTEDDDSAPNEKYRRDPQYRHSLAAITERRSARNSLTNESGKSFYRTYNNKDTTLENADYVRHSNGTTDHKAEYKAEKAATSPTSSNYLSWIESVNSEYFESTISNEAAQDADSKVGEWNNFWLNYSNARLRHLSTEQTFSSEGADRTADDQSEDRKSQGSTQKDVTDKNSMEYVTLTMEEIQETLRCSQKITDILQNAMKRSEIDESSNESYYSQEVSGKNSDDRSVNMMVNRERSISCVDSQTLQRQKQMLKPTQQSSSTSCIDAILNTGVADILKKVILKRREVIASDSETRSPTRSSFSEWSSR